jgi:site-specific DNA-methyltransferase (adenine-specific)
MDLVTDDIKLMFGDCLERMKEIKSGSIDMILTDPPYGTTACKWDSIIPLAPMWEQLKRIIKPNGAIVMTAAQPFTSALIMSNADMFKYCWYWKKNRATGVLNAKKQPLRNVEEVVVFNSKIYAPQGLLEVNIASRNSKKDYDNYGDGTCKEYTQKYTNYPTQLLNFDVVQRTVHSTQKPVPLMEYLIKTYTDEGETVLDFTMGSGTTGVAAVNTRRKFVGIEIGSGFYGISCGRIMDAVILSNSLSEGTL